MKKYTEWTNANNGKFKFRIIHNPSPYCFYFVYVDAGNGTTHFKFKSYREAVTFCDALKSAQCAY